MCDSQDCGLVWSGLGATCFCKEQKVIEIFCMSENVSLPNVYKYLPIKQPEKP